MGPSSVMVTLPSRLARFQAEPVAILKVDAGEVKVSDGCDFLAGATGQPLVEGYRVMLPAEAQAEDAAVVRLDPGLAFGSGTHPTTALCLEWLDGLTDAGNIDEIAGYIFKRSLL